MARTYGKKAQRKIGRVMEEFKEGELKTRGRRVKSRKQAIAIGISEARREGDTVPPKRRGASAKQGRKSAGRKSAAKKTARKTAKKTRGPGRKRAAKKAARRKRGARKS